MHIHFHHLRDCRNYWLFEYPLFWNYLHNNIVLYTNTYSVLHHIYLKPTRYIIPSLYANAFFTSRQNFADGPSLIFIFRPTLQGSSAFLAGPSSPIAKNLCKMV